MKLEPDVLFGGARPSTNRSESAWQDIKAWLLAYPDKTHAIFTPDGMYYVTFKPHPKRLKGGSHV